MIQWMMLWERGKQMEVKEREKLATKIMMNALEGVKAQIRKAYDKGYKDGKADTPFTDTEEAENKAYNRGLNDAWDAARKLVHRINGGYTETEKKIIFDNSASDSILLNYTAAEVITRIKVYEDKQIEDEEKDTIKERLAEFRATLGCSYGEIYEVLKEMRGEQTEKSCNNCGNDYKTCPVNECRDRDTRKLWTPKQTKDDEDDATKTEIESERSEEK